jgi:hypothetical protein
MITFVPTAVSDPPARKNDVSAFFFHSGAREILRSEYIPRVYVNPLARIILRLVVRQMR